ncbi:unnamed protein product [Trichobilharzia regenti]|nr:unnamed protein product [Trichobilharzia regenti]
MISFIISKPCNQRRNYPVSVLLKYNPTSEWLSEGWEVFDKQIPSESTDATDQCIGDDQQSNIVTRNIMKELYQNYSLSPIVFIREKSINDIETHRIKEYFKRNESAYLSGFDSPGGYLEVEGSAFCRDPIKVKNNQRFSNDELNLAYTIRMIFRVSLSQVKYIHLINKMLLSFKIIIVIITIIVIFCVLKF